MRPKGEKGKPPYGHEFRLAVSTAIGKIGNKNKLSALQELVLRGLMIFINDWSGATTVGYRTVSEHIRKGEGDVRVAEKVLIAAGILKVVRELPGGRREIRIELEVLQALACVPERPGFGKNRAPRCSGQFAAAPARAEEANCSGLSAAVGAAEIAEGLQRKKAGGCSGKTGGGAAARSLPNGRTVVTREDSSKTQNLLSSPPLSLGGAGGQLAAPVRDAMVPTVAERNDLGCRVVAENLFLTATAFFDLPDDAVHAALVAELATRRPLSFPHLTDVDLADIAGKVMDEATWERRRRWIAKCRLAAREADELRSRVRPMATMDSR
jgi:hypothetical protein